MSWRDDKEAFLRHLRASRGLSEHTVRAYDVDLRAFYGFWEEQGVELDRVCDVDVRHLRRYVAAHYDVLARSTLSRRLSALRSYLEWQVRRGAVGANRGRLVQAPKSKRPLVEFLGVDDVFRLMEPEPNPDRPLDVRDAAMWELLYGSGLRVGELVALDVGALRLDDGWVRVRGKGDKERDVPLGLPRVLT